MNPLTYIHDESVRQSATVKEMGGMCRAYHNLALHTGPVTEGLICDTSWEITGNAVYRRVPVYFRSGGHAMNWMSVPRAMEALVEWINDNAARGSTADVDEQIREFLVIHPFVDGNGRVASLLRNYLLGTLSDPTPLPYYFGEN